jgi:hypothetical protein
MLQNSIKTKKPGRPKGSKNTTAVKAKTVSKVKSVKAPTLENKISKAAVLYSKISDRKSQNVIAKYNELQTIMKDRQVSSVFKNINNIK